MCHDGRVDLGAPGSGTRLATWSLVCALALIPTFVVLELVGGALMALLDVPEQTSITTAGAAGWVAGISLALLLVVPPAIGLWLGLRARRHDGGRRAVVGIVVNALLGGYLLATGVVGLVAL